MTLTMKEIRRIKEEQPLLAMGDCTCPSKIMELCEIIERQQEVLKYYAYNSNHFTGPLKDIIKITLPAGVVVSDGGKRAIEALLDDPVETFEFEGRLL